MAWESELWLKKCRWIMQITWEINSVGIDTLLYWHSVCCIDTLVVLTLCLYWLEILCDPLFDDLRFWMLAEKTQMNYADHLGNKLGNTCKTHISAQWAENSDALFVLTWVSEWWHPFRWLEILCDAFFDDLRFWMMAEKMQMNYADHLGFVVTPFMMTWDSECWLKKCRWIMQITWEINSETVAKRTPLQNTLFLYWHPKKTRKTKRKESVC